jgi:hypothetical protein
LLRGLRPRRIRRDCEVLDDDPTLRASWDGYVAAIEVARAIINGSPFVQGTADLAQGESFLRGIVNHSLATALGNTPEQPLMQLLPYPDTRLGYNNPDNLYYVTRVSDQCSYTIKGKRGTSTGLLIQAVGPGLPGYGDAAGATTSFFAGSDLRVASDGSYSLTFSTEEPAQGDWLPLVAGTDNVLVRFSFQDWQHETPGTIAIVRTGGPESAHVEMTPELAGTMLDEAARSIPLQAAFYRDMGSRLASISANSVVGPQRTTGYAAGNVQQWNLAGTFNLHTGQGLLVTIKDVPQARYANFMAADPWLDSFEFLHHQSSLNHDQTRVDDDGYVRYVLSARDPGVPNWIDTSELSHGIIFGRFQEVDGELGPEYAPTSAVVDVADLRQHLPGNTPSVSPPQRAEQLAERNRLLVARFRDADPQHHEILRRLGAVEDMLGRDLPLHSIRGEQI